MEKRMKELENKVRIYHSILDNMEEAVICQKPNGKIIMVNKPSESLFGCSQEDILSGKEKIENFIEDSHKSMYQMHMKDLALPGKEHRIYLMSKNSKDPSKYSNPFHASFKYALLFNQDDRKILDEIVTYFTKQADILDVTTVCAWCKKVKSPDNGYIPAHEYLQQEVDVSHGMCPDCYNAHNQEILNLNKS